MTESSGLTGVKHHLLVSSGKGGVGKSTVAANLAASLAHQGLRIGLLDADISGPSQAVMWALPENTSVKVSTDPQLSLPFVQYGVKITTLATRISESQAVSWRGPMMSMGVINLLCHTDWGELDCLVVDMPPGTGDVHTSICDKLPSAGVVTVTTPQRVAVADTRRGMQMYQNRGLRLLGVVENMSTHVCENCGHTNHVFGHSGAATLCQEFDTKILCSLPLNAELRWQGDEGAPLVVADPSHILSALFLDTASEIWRLLND
jgi:ATP-binding protein involved in chromosome partitioning